MTRVALLNSRAVSVLELVLVARLPSLPAPPVRLVLLVWSLSRLVLLLLVTGQR
jgi:hypothetical protein